MKLHYYSETDSLYIEFRDVPAADSQEVAEGVVADFDEQGQLVGLDIDGGAAQTTLSELEVVGINTTAIKAAS